METADLDGRERVLRCTDAFIEALRATHAVRSFVEARCRYEADREVQSIMDTLQRFQRAQQTGEAAPTELQDVRDAQMRLRTHRVVQEYIGTRDAVGALLRATNLTVSEILGLDFGQTVGPVGGPC